MGSKKTKSTQVSTPNVPSWIQSPQQSFMGNVNSLMGDWSKGVTPASAMQKQAFGMAQDIPGATQKFMNPYETTVINGAMGDMDRSRQMQIANDQARATAAGAFGGARHGVADSLTNDEYFRDVGNMAGQLRYNGYNQAQDAAFRNVGLLADLGEQQRQLDARANPNSVESLQAMSGLLGYNPAMYVGNTTNTTQRTSGGGLGQVLGGLGTLAMGLGTGGLGFAPLAGLGAAKNLGSAAGFTPGWGSGLFGNLK